MKKTALFTGISIILMAIFAWFSYWFVIPKIIKAWNLELTISNLNANYDLFLYWIISFWIVFLLDIIVSVWVYLFYKNKSKVLSKFAGILRMIYSWFLAVALVKLSNILYQNEINNIWDHFQSFSHIWQIGLVIFGAHLLILWFLNVKYYSKIIWWLLVFAGIGYIITSFGNAFLGDYIYKSQIELILTPIMALWEIIFAFWLVYKWVEK